MQGACELVLHRWNRMVDRSSFWVKTIVTYHTPLTKPWKVQTLTFCPRRISTASFVLRHMVCWAWNSWAEHLRMPVQTWWLVMLALGWVYTVYTLLPQDIGFIGESVDLMTHAVGAWHPSRTWSWNSGLKGQWNLDGCTANVFLAGLRWLTHAYTLNPYLTHAIRFGHLSLWNVILTLRLVLLRQPCGIAVLEAHPVNQTGWAMADAFSYRN